MLNPGWEKRNSESLLGEMIPDLSLIKCEYLLKEEKGLVNKRHKKQRSRKG